ncbi:MAG: hypothetical protein ACREPM_25295 [Gemmatimonadaceae bacterium]
MTIPSITCEVFAARLADFLEQGASDPMRAALETHAARCADCGALLADLRELRVNAAALAPLAPEHDLWAGIAARIETPVVEITPAGPLDASTGRRTPRMNRVWTGLAAAGLVAVTATVTYQVTKSSVAVATPRTVAAAAPVTSDTPAALTNVALTPEQKTYDAEIARLRAIVTERRPMLDTATIRVIDRNLMIIDSAIEQCRQALVKDPASRFLMQSLNDALDSKVQLLKAAVTLPSRA